MIKQKFTYTKKKKSPKITNPIEKQPDMKSDEFPPVVEETKEQPQTFDPLAQQVIEKDYTSGKLEGQQVTTDDIPEVVFQQTAPETPGSTAPGEQPAPEPVMEHEPDAINSAKLSAKAIVNTIGAVLPLPFRSWAKISETKFNKLGRDGIIDINQKMQIAADKVTTLEEFVFTRNVKIDQTFVVSDADKEAMEGPLERILLKNGMVLSDEMQFLIAFGMCTINMGMQAMRLSKEGNEYMEYFIEQEKEKKAKAEPTVQEVSTKGEPLKEAA